MMMFPSWQETFLALHAAETRQELWAVLLAPHGIRCSSAWEEPFILFGRFHRDDAHEATITALLVCTDTRWRKGAHQLIRQLADSGVLDDTALDDLASSFLGPQVALVAMSDPVSGQFIDKSLTDPVTADQLIVQRPVWAEAGPQTGVGPQRRAAIETNDGRHQPSLFEAPASEE